VIDIVKGEDAIKRIGEINTDIVLMDIQLKGESDGIQIAKGIHKLYNIPFIYLSGVHDNTTLKMAKQTEPSGFITIPFLDREVKKILVTQD